VNLDTCHFGGLHPPTNRSLGIAIRPRKSSPRPVLRFYIQERLMEEADFYIGDRVIAKLADDATHIKIEQHEEGYMLWAAANNYMCVNYEDAVEGTQYTARFDALMTEEVIEKYKFHDKCTTFVEPSYIRKGKYIIAPLDDMPIWRINGV
jgi:hypothetical protein